VWAIVVAAGRGSRFGGTKQFGPLGGRRVVDWCLAAAGASCDGVVVVMPADALEPGAVAGGATRSASVRAGLAAVPASAEVVVVHDAARPLAGADLFERVVAAVRGGADAAVPGLALGDTVKRVRDGWVQETLDRGTLVAVQTPQAFRAAVLRQAHADGGDATDDAALVEAGGGVVAVVAGDPRNLKITGPDDLVVAAALLARRRSARVGLGFDVHPFAPDPARPLVLGGVTIAGGPGLAGHSDADVVAHAVADALLGAAGLGDLGEHFPDDDPAWHGADSSSLLAGVVAMVAAAGWEVANVDVAVVLESPRLAPHRAAMQDRLGEVVRAPVSVKAKRAEGLGSLGRGEGVACWAVALLDGGR